MNDVREFVGMAFAIAFGLLSALNGAVMLISPRKWFDMPGWLAFRGNLTRQRYGFGWGTLQVRVLGALLLGFVACVVWQLCSGTVSRTFALARYPSAEPHKIVPDPITIRLAWCFTALCATWILLNAIVMACSPRAWLNAPRWLRMQIVLPRDVPGFATVKENLCIRLTGIALTLAVACGMWALVLPGLTAALTR